MKWILRLLSFAVSFFFLALAVSLGQVDSMLIDFQNLPAEQLELFRYGFFVAFMAFLVAVPLIGD